MAQMEAIVLHTLQYKDSSKILYLYSKTGHHSVIARGVKKHNNINRFLSQNTTIISIDQPMKNLATLSDGSLVEEFSKLKMDPFAYAYSNHICELVNHVVNEDADHEKMYSFLTRILHLINNGQDPEVVGFLFELKLLHFIGYGLNFKHCSICQATENLQFVVSNGGLVCTDHIKSNTHTYDADIYHHMMKLYYLDIKKEDIPIIDETSKIIIRHILDLLYDEFVSYRSKSLKIIEQFKKY